MWISGLIYIVISIDTIFIYQLSLWIYCTFVVRRYYYIVKENKGEEEQQLLPEDPNNAHNVDISMQIQNQNENIWKCPLCAYEQSRSNVECEMCETLNPAHREQEGETAFI